MYVVVWPRVRGFRVGFKMGFGCVCAFAVPLLVCFYFLFDFVIRF